MGADYSIGSDYHSWMARLSLKDYTEDPKFWTTLISRARDIFEESLPFPRLIDEIAIKYPNNFDKMISFCLDHLELLTKSESKDTVPSMIQNQLAASAYVITACIMLIVRDPRLHSIADRYDPDLSSLLPSFESITNPSSPDTQSIPNANSSTQEPVHSKEDEIESFHDEHSDEDGPIVDVEKDLDDQEQTAEQSPLPPLESAISGYGSPKLIEHGGKGTEIIKPTNSTDNSILTRFLRVLIILAFKPHIATGPGGWFKGETPHERKTREIILHCLLELVNLGLHAREFHVRFWISPLEIPMPLFLESVCIGNRRYLHSFLSGNTPTEHEIALQRNSLTLAAFLCGRSDSFRSAWAAVPAESVLSAFILPELSATVIATDPNNDLASESLSLLFMATLCSPGLASAAAASKCSNAIIVGLLYAQQVTFERVGPCFVQNLVLETITILLHNTSIGELLDEPFVGSMPWSLRPHRGSYIDLIIEVLLLSATSPQILPLTAKVLKEASHTTSNISLFSAVQMLRFFQTQAVAFQDDHSENSECVKEGIKTFCDAWANWVMRAHDNNSLAVMCIWDSLKVFSKFNPQAIQRMKIFTSALKPILKHSCGDKQKKKVSVDEVLESIRMIHITALYDGMEMFDNEMLKFDSISDVWNDWCDFLYSRCFSEEKERLENLDRFVKLSINPQPIMMIPNQNINEDGNDDD